MEIRRGFQTPKTHVFFHNHFGELCQWTCRQHTIHPISKERGGGYRAMASSRDVLREGWKRVKEGEFDWWMVWKWMSWVVINTCQCQSMHPLPRVLRNSLVCIKTNVFLPARPIPWCWHVLPGLDTVQGVRTFIFVFIANETSFYHSATLVMVHQHSSIWRSCLLSFGFKGFFFLQLCFWWGLPFLAETTFAG